MKNLLLAVALLFSFNADVNAGKSYSGGSSGGKSSSGVSSGGFGKSYSAPKISSSPPPRSQTPSYKPSAAPAQSNSNSNSIKPNSGSSWNNSLTNSAKKEESRVAYQKANPPAPKPTPAPTYKTPTGTEKKLDASSPQVTSVRKNLNPTTYNTYNQRTTVFYGSHYGHPQPYNDFFSPFLMGWIMSDAMNSQQRALWMYHHSDDMDHARYEEMLRRDANLQRQIDFLKKDNLPKDPTYVPPQMKDNPDVMYDETFVKASYNPEDVNYPDDESSSPVTWYGFLGCMKWFFIAIAVIALVWFLFWLFFVRDF